jgi:hypothetical protein
MILLFLYGFSIFAAEPIQKVENAFSVDKIILKKVTPKYGLLEVKCKERPHGSENEVMIHFSFKKNKKVNLSGLILKTKTANTCASYKFILDTNLNLISVSNPGEKINEAGAILTVKYLWQDSSHSYQESNRQLFSPFKEVRQTYKKQLDDFELLLAEKTLIQKKKKVAAALDAQLTTTAQICEEFQKAYLAKADLLLKKRKISDAVDTLYLMKQKFGDPQNIFYDSNLKNNSLVLICQKETSNNDQSEDQFYTFARRYLNKVEYVPYLLKKVQQSINLKTPQNNELAVQALKFVSFVLKSGDSEFQIKNQPELIRTWNLLIKDNPEHANYERLIEEDTHLIFLLAQNKKCAQLPQSVLNRISQKNDSAESLKSMSLAAADDFYSEGLEQSAVFEYKQYSQGRALLKKCEQIPKTVLDRYFKFIKEQPYAL